MEYTHSEISKNIGIISRVSRCFPLLYEDCSIIHWCNPISLIAPVTGPQPTRLTSLTYLKRLHKIIICIITKSPFNSHSQLLFQKLGLLNNYYLSRIRNYQIGKYMFKHFYNLLPRVFDVFYPKHTYTIIGAQLDGIETAFS